MPSMARVELDRLVSLSTSGKWDEVLSNTRSLAIDQFDATEAAQVLFFEGLALLHLEQPEQAQLAVQLGLEYAASRPELLDLAARVASALGRTSEAAVFHERAIENAPEEVRPLLMINYAATLAHEEDYAESIKLLEAAESAGHGCYELHLLMARAHSGLGHNKRALARFADANRDRPAEVAPRIGIANALAKLGRTTQAEALYDQLRGLGFDGDVYYNWAVARLARSDPMGVIALCKVIPHDHSHYPLMLCLHAKALLQMGADSAALRLLERGIGSMPTTRDRATHYDDYCATEAEAIAANEDTPKARRRLLWRLSRVKYNLPRSLCVLALFNDPPEGSVQRYEVVLESHGGEWVERLLVQAANREDAIALAYAIHVPDDVTSAFTSVREGGEVPSYAQELPPVRGVLSRRFDLLGLPRKK